MLIHAEKLGHSYRFLLFENIWFNIDLGDFLSIYWPSGSGKSTLLEIIGNLLLPKTGTITFDESLTDRQKSFGYAFVGWPFFEEMNVRQNILFLENFAKITLDIDWYEELIDFFEIKKYENIPIKELSVGQRERVNIVRAFVHRPQVAILDEPGINLDHRLFGKLFDFLEKQKKNQKVCICIATHNDWYKDISTKIITIDPSLNV